MYLWLSFLLLFGPAWAGQTQCPTFCECIISGTATCTSLDIEPFPTEDIHTLELKQLQGPITLTGEVLTKLRLPNIRRLVIDGAVVSRLDPSVFSTHRIEQFVLLHSKIPTIDKALFRKSKFISQIDLSYSTIERFDGIESPYVDEVVLVGCGLTEIPPQALSVASLPALSFLSLQDNRISNINISDLAGEQIDLSGNVLTNVKIIPSEAIDLLVSLKLDNNPMHTIHAEDDVSIQALHMSNCQLKNLNFLKNFSELTTLDVSYNLISEVHPKLFVNIDQLENLNLSYNNLTTIPEDFSPLESLVKLTLDGNKLDTLPKFKFNGAMNFVSCNNCKLKYLDEQTFDHFRTTKQILLSDNYLTSLPANVFSKVLSLVKLDLTNNSLETLPLNIFKSNPDLKTVILRGNPLGSVDPAWFKDNKELLTVDISACGLTRLWKNQSGIKLEKVTNLKASNNSIKEVAIEDLEVTPKLENLFLIGNPLACNEANEHMSDWLYERMVITTHSAKCAWKDYDSRDDGTEMYDYLDEQDDGKTLLDEEDVDDSSKNVVEPNKDSKDDDDDEADDDDDDDKDDVNDVDANVPKTKQEQKKEFLEDAGLVQAVEQGRFNERQRTSKEILFFVLPTLVFVLTALVVLLFTVTVILCILQKRHGQRTNAPQITILPWSSGVKMKKHSGSIYRPLSEEKIPV